jgi:hypothetical protein
MKIEWANKHSIVAPESFMRTSSDVPVVRLDELARWLEQHDLNGTHLRVMLTELRQLRGTP